MKKLFTLLFLMITVGSNAQITLEHSYPNSSMTAYNLKLVKLSSSGYKYVTNDTSTITLYNLNHTVFKTMTIPITGGVGNQWAVKIYYISEELFDLDSTDIEYFLFYYDASGIYHTKVCDEFGNVLFSKDTTTIVLNVGQGNEDFISFTTSGVKMIIYDYYGGAAYVYSLPGFLPCHDCVNGITSSMAELSGNPQNGGISKLYPNPTSGQTTVEYTLPQGITKADLVVYDMQGHEIKRYKVTNAFNTIIINANELAAGTYYYQIQTSAGFNAGKKMIVIK
jgi:hypothetical protein